MIEPGRREVTARVPASGLIAVGVSACAILGRGARSSPPLGTHSGARTLVCESCFCYIPPEIDRIAGLVCCLLSPHGSQLVPREASLERRTPISRSRVVDACRACRLVLGDRRLRRCVDDRSLERGDRTDRAARGKRWAECRHERCGSERGHRRSGGQRPGRRRRAWRRQRSRRAVEGTVV
jgi:hypothetical protein